MKYVEVSKKIKLGVEVSEEDLKQSLMTRMRRAFAVDELREQPHNLHISATSGGPGRMMRYARVDLNITVSKTKDTARVIMYGYTQVAKSMLFSYSFLFFLVLMTGLLPGSVATSGEDSGPLDAMVFLIFGIFIFYDINKQLHEAQEQLKAVLDSLETEFG
ncbi:MAG: hypothetical protein WBK55_09985 [Alphaproteobacteria bacterium]